MLTNFVLLFHVRMIRTFLHAFGIIGALCKAIRRIVRRNETARLAYFVVRFFIAARADKRGFVTPQNPVFNL